LPNNFNWKVYSKYCQGITNEILIKKHYLESYNRKLEAEQLLNIIIIKKTNLPIETVILDFNNMKVTISIISENKEYIEHYNVRKYIIDSTIQNKLNEVIKNNTSKYYMILFDILLFKSIKVFHQLIVRPVFSLKSLYKLSIVFVLIV
jgi:hypothetical protein